LFVNSDFPITSVRLCDPDRFLIVVIDGSHISHLQPGALSTICLQQLIFGVGKVERSVRLGFAVRS
jgi:hypothetical protein